MTTHEPLPQGTHYGRANWENYNDYWREQDAEWLQDRLVTRFVSANDRLAAIPNAQAGQVTYNGAIDKLEVFSAQKLNWLSINAFLWLGSTDEATGVTFFHRDAQGKGITLRENELYFDLPVNNNNVLKVSYLPTPGVVIQTGTAAATLTTDATGLVIDKPLSIPSLTFTGAGPTVINTSNKNVDLGSGLLTAANISMSGTLSGGGTINGFRGTIGGIKLGVTVMNQAEAPAGFVSQGGIVYGDVDGMIVKSKTGTPTLEVNTTSMILTNGTTLLRNTIEVDNSSGVLRNAVWRVPSTAPDGWLAPVVFSTPALNAADYPVGTIWIQ
jgi:hypothetical protein